MTMYNLQLVLQSARARVLQLTGAQAQIVFYRRLKMGHLSLDVRQSRRRRGMQSHVGENQPLLVIVLAEDLVVAEIKSVAHAESAIRNAILPRYTIVSSRKFTVFAKCSLRLEGQG